MSTTLSDREELLQLLGGTVDTTSLDATTSRGIEASLLPRIARAQIAKAMKDQDVSLRSLAAKLHVSPAAVSRRMRSEGDLHLGTIAVIAHALGRDWTLVLNDPTEATLGAGNFPAGGPSAKPEHGARSAPRAQAAAVRSAITVSVTSLPSGTSSPATATRSAQVVAADG